MLAYNYNDPGDVPDWFWAVIQSAERSGDKLRIIMGALPTEEIYRFEAAFGGAVSMIRDDRFHVHRDDGTEDAIDDITEWAVGQGKEYYYDVWNGVARLPEYGPGDEHLYVALLEVYEERFGDVPADRQTEGAVHIVA